MKKISIENLSMSTRSRHILHKLGIETVDQLMETQIEIIAEQKMWEPKQFQRLRIL